MKGLVSSLEEASWRWDHISFVRGMETASRESSFLPAPNLDADSCLPLSIHQLCSLEIISSSVKWNDNDRTHLGVSLGGSHGWCGENPCETLSCAWLWQGANIWVVTVLCLSIYLSIHLFIYRSIPLFPLLLPLLLWRACSVYKSDKWTKKEWEGTRQGSILGAPAKIPLSPLSVFITNDD